MSTFVSNYSVALTLSGTATNQQVPRVQPKGSAGMETSLMRGRFCRIKNYHASQLAYVKLQSTATTSDYHFAIPPAGGETIFPLQENTAFLSLIAAGASTTVVLDIGDFIH